MENKKKIVLVTGGNGLVGKYLQDIMPDAIYLSSKDGDLRDYIQTEAIFEKYKPDVLIHLAAKVGGIIENLKLPSDYLEFNIAMNSNVLKCALKYKVNHVIAMLSTCIFPDRLSDDKYPLTLKNLHDSAPTEANFSYGYAKRCLSVQISCYNKQYGTRWNCITPPNLYGIYDQFENHDKAHFVTALLKKIKVAKDNNDDFITLFGTGTPLRQFLYAKDLAKAIKISVDQDIREDFVVAPPENISIKKIAEIALKACDAEHLKIKFDITKPDGQFRKDVKNSDDLLPNFQFTKLEEGLKETFGYIDSIK